MPTSPAASGTTVVLCFIGVPGPEVCEERVSMRVSQGGHAVPGEKLVARFPRILGNLCAAIRRLLHVRVYDNGDLRLPFRQVAVFDEGRAVFLGKPVPKWLRPIPRPARRPLS